MSNKYDAAYQAGRDAYYDGLGSDANPYNETEHDDWAADWEQGFWDAKADEERSDDAWYDPNPDEWGDWDHDEDSD